MSLEDFKALISGNFYDNKQKEEPSKVPAPDAAMEVQEEESKDKTGGRTQFEMKQASSVQTASELLAKLAEKKK